MLILIGLYCSYGLCIIEIQTNYSFCRKDFHPLGVTQDGNYASRSNNYNLD